MAMSSALTVLLFSLIFCMQVIEHMSPYRRCSNQDTMSSSLDSFFSNMERRLTALETSWNIRTEKQLARVEAMMEKEMQEKLQKLCTLDESFNKMEQTTKELVTRVSAVEGKLDKAMSLPAEEMGKTRMMCEDIQKWKADFKYHKAEEYGPVSYIRTCQTYYEEGHSISGVYRLQLQDGQGPMEVFCDMSEGAGFVVFQRRQDGSVDFYRNWTSYEEGFGDLLREFWLGNRNIHRLTSAGLTQLRVDLQAWNGSTAFASYSHFSVGDASSSYRLSVSGYSGTAGDSLVRHSRHKFSTFDLDNDASSGDNCAQQRKGAWWYDACTDSNLNGEYGTRDSSDWQYVTWHHWLGLQSLQRTELKLK